MKGVEEVLDPVTGTIILSVTISCFAGASLVFLAGATAGFKALVIDEFLAILMSFVVSAFLSLTNDIEVETAMKIAIVTAATASVSTLAAAFILDRNLQNARRLAHDVQSFGSIFFDALDKDGDGVFNADDIRNAFTRGAIGQKWKLIANHTMSQIKEIGHVTGYYESYVAGIEGRTAQVQIAQYGIDKQDLRTYHRRLTTRYARWYRTSDWLRSRWQ